MLQTHYNQRYDTDEVAAGQDELSGVPFDDMERGDAVVLCFRRTTQYLHDRAAESSWECIPAVCISAGKSRTFQSLEAPSPEWPNAAPRRWSMKSGAFTLYRIPYRWRQAVLALHETYESREAIEAAMEATTQRKAA